MSRAEWEHCLCRKRGHSTALVNNRCDSSNHAANSDKATPVCPTGMERKACALTYARWCARALLWTLLKHACTSSPQVTSRCLGVEWRKSEVKFYKSNSNFKSLFGNPFLTIRESRITFMWSPVGTTRPARVQKFYFSQFICENGLAEQNVSLLQTCLPESLFMD